MIYYFIVFNRDSGLLLIDLDYGYLEVDSIRISGFVSALNSFIKEYFREKISRILLIKFDEISIKLIQILTQLEMLLVYDNDDKYIRFITAKIKDLIYDSKNLFEKQYENFIAKRKPLGKKISQLIAKYNKINFKTPKRHF